MQADFAPQLSKRHLRRPSGKASARLDRQRPRVRTSQRHAAPTQRKTLDAGLCGIEARDLDERSVVAEAKGFEPKNRAFGCSNV